tara:strand:- start:32540 stop:33100 length:561 start_codon:yes stop_codon:yes gene_type:complete
MAKTELHNYSVQEKLNKMDLDVISITTPTAVNVDTAGKIAIIPLEIPNAVSVPGGTAILQTCLVYNPTTNDMPLDVFISDTNDGVSGSTWHSASVGTATASTDMQADALMDTAGNVETLFKGIQCFFSTGTGQEVGNADNLSFVSSIGAPVKAASGSTSLYLWALAGSTSTTPNAVFEIKLGFVKD